MLQAQMTREFRLLQHLALEAKRQVWMRVWMQVGLQQPRIGHYQIQEHNHHLRTLESSPRPCTDQGYCSRRRALR